jgi:proteasome beta subunit
MTTLVGMKIETPEKSFVLLGSDGQLTSGSFKHPFQFKKILVEGSCLIGGTGSLGQIQNIVRLAKRNIRLDRVMNEDLNLNLTLSQLVKELSQMNFSLPLEYKAFNPFGFMLGGIGDDGQPELVSVGDDGSVIHGDFFADGSGSPYAWSVLNSKYASDLSLVEASNIIFECLNQSSQLDIYSNNKFEVLVLIYSKEEGKFIVKELKQVLEGEEPAKPEEIEAIDTEEQS